jgi:Lon protease-like protein
VDAAVEPEFALFPLRLVALPYEYVPLHVFEERFKTMIRRCLADGEEFGILWLGEDELKPVGCACAIERVLEELPDGRMNILARGTRPFRLRERLDHLPYPAGRVEFLEDREEEPDDEAAEVARGAYSEIVEQATDSTPDRDEIALMSAYEMAARVDFGLDAKQGLLELRSEAARLRLLTRLLRAALRRLEFVDRVQVRARSNGKVALS